MEIQFSLANIREAAKKFITEFDNRKVIAFHGEMGVGKTTFIHAVCDVLGVKDTVGSPTFSIINEYVSESRSIFHIDLYRINSTGEAVQAGVEDCFYSGHTCFIEWPEKVAALIPDDALHVEMRVVDENTRVVLVN